MKGKIVLASGSPRRKELLSQVGLEFEVKVSKIEEKITKSEPKDVVMELSCQKAKAVWEELKEDQPIVIGADTVVSVDGKILGKPRDRKEAHDMIKMLSGKAHSVFTGVTLIVDGHYNTFAEETKVFVYEMDEESIQKYIDSDEPYDKAGAYGIQGRFAAFVKGIEGDYNNVVGLPVARICEELRRLGYEI